MSPHKMPPSMRQRRLGAELRRLRELADLSVTEAAALEGSTQPRLSSIEAGRYAVGADRVRAMARNYGCMDEAYIEALAEMTGGRVRGWWDEYRERLPADALELAEAEHHTAAFRYATMAHIPGLLQTRAHAYAVIADAVPPFHPPAIEHRVSFRIKRQEVLYREDPAPLTAILHETGLRMGFGGPETSRAQLEHLLQVSEMPHVTIRVIPFGVGSYPSSGAGVTYLAGRVPELDTVQLDTDHGPAFLDTRPQLAKYRIVLDSMETCSLTPAKSRDLIHRVRREL
ncbi:helix-turn-helix transcriptional regulator [Streptomyces tremellae]|uniref:Helix-turn-helix transcriptional regulator n=2 Tax=Streptomyces tremellae TaxID=1124239 RepID=A0ABP7EV01_9ACTN